MKMDKRLSNGKQKSVDDRLQNFQMGNKQQNSEDDRLKYMMHWHVNRHITVLRYSGSFSVIHWLYNGDTICSPISRTHQPLLAKSLGKWWNYQADRECSDMVVVHSRISTLFKFISDEPFRIQIWWFLKNIFHLSIDEGFWKI